jgi:ribonuclease HI
MAWRRMTLRGKRVLARCDDSGRLSEQRGRVEIRYAPRDGRAYFASSRNLEAGDEDEVLPDDHCGQAEQPESKKGRGAGKTRNRTAGGERAVAPPSAPSGEEVLVYADGACSGNPGPAGLGVVMLWDDRRRELSEYLGKGTNNIAELTALLRAAEALQDTSRPVRIYTDSSYSIGVLTKGWKAKANKKLVGDVKEALGKLADVELHHVPGHAGVVLNERADALARIALESQQSPGWQNA